MSNKWKCLSGVIALAVVMVVESIFNGDWRVGAGLGGICGGPIGYYGGRWYYDWLHS